MADEGSMNGACHCGAVRLRVKLSGGGLGSPRRCNCSYCRMRGAVVVSASVDDLEVVSGAEALALYQFNTKVAEHHFCSRCGIYTHHKRRANPNQYGVNVAILEGVSPFDFAEVLVTDGVNHPSDGRSGGIVGTLRFIPAR
jgi:hypothetical protein